MKVYQVEVGVLLNENDEEFESYNMVFDEKYGYYHENLWFCKTYEEAKESALEYVENGVEKTYAIISEIEDFDENEHDIESGLIIDKETGYDIDILEFANFELESVIKSYKKENGKIVEDFVKVKGK